MKRKDRKKQKADERVEWKEYERGRAEDYWDQQKKIAALEAEVKSLKVLLGVVDDGGRITISYDIKGG